MSSSSHIIEQNDPVKERPLIKSCLEGSPKLKKRGRGRPLKFPLEIRKKVCITNGKYNVSFQSVGDLLKYLNGTEYEAKVNTSERITVEGHLCLKYYLAELLSQSDCVSLGVDGSGTGMGRKFEEIEFWATIKQLANGSIWRNLLMI